MRERRIYTMAKRHDWEAIEAEVRAGVKSVNSIAHAHGVAESTIRKRAKKYGWKRDLTTSVRSAARAKLVRNDGANGASLRTGSEITDADIIEQASDEITQVVVGHRKHVNEWKGIASKLSVALGEMDVHESNHNEFARSLNSGVDAIGKLIKLERQAYSMDDDDKADEPAERSLTDDELEARIAELSKKVSSE